MNAAEKKALSKANRILSARKPKRKAWYDKEFVQCFKGCGQWHREIGEINPGDPCPNCGHPVKTAIGGYYYER